MLFNQIGGMAAVQAVVTEFLTVVGGDSRINGFFATTDLTTLGRLLVEQICSATGGYCVYTGRSMAEAHAGMGVTDGSQPIDALLLALLDMRGDIVTAR